MIKVYPISYSVNNFNMTFSCTFASKKSVYFFFRTSQATQRQAWRNNTQIWEHQNGALGKCRSVVNSNKEKIIITVPDF